MSAEEAGPGASVASGGCCEAARRWRLTGMDPAFLEEIVESEPFTE
jgi:hypothetical protein